MINQYASIEHDSSAANPGRVATFQRQKIISRRYQHVLRTARN